MSRNVRFSIGVSAIALVMVPMSATAQETANPDTAAQTQGQQVLDSAGVREETGPGNEIVVTGIRRSLESAQAVKRDSDEIVESVVAEDIGKLPDVTASESLARVTGVQVDRNAGIAQNVRIRGLPDITTTYNGREVFTGDGRSVALQDFPSNSIARLDVYKAASANLLEPGLAGLIDVRSRRPLDFKGSRVAGAVNGLHWYQSQRLGVEANLLASTRWSTGIGDMGIMIEGSYADTKFLDPSRVVSQTISNRTNIPGYVGTALRYPGFVNTNYSQGTRWRPNMSGSFQWRPSSTLEFYLDGLYQGYRAENDARTFQVASGDAAVLSNIVLFEGTNQIRSMDATAGGQVTSTQQVNDQSTDTYQGGGGFIWKPGRLRVTGDLVYTESTFLNTAYTFNFTSVTQPARHFEFDTPQGVGGGTVTISNFDMFNPANFRWTNITESGNRQKGTGTQGRIDLDYKLGALGISNLQGGLRYSTRDAEQFTYAQTDTAPANRLLSSLPLIYRSSGGLRSDDATTIKTWLSPTRDSLVDNIEALRALAGQGNPAFTTPTYTINEKTYSGYLQARYDFDLGVPIDGLIGFRVTRTEDTIAGFERVTTGGVTTVRPISQENQYTDFLPNVSARIHLDPKVQLRLAFTETRTRPSFANLSPSITIGNATTCSSDATLTCAPASSGNPDLQPVQATNYDASLEYYFSPSGAVTAGVFYKDLTGFINTTTTIINDPTFGRIELTRPENGGEGRIKGVEASARTFFRADWLPNWMRDFGALANFTYLDATSELSPSLSTGPKGLPGQQKIAGVSKYIYNLSGFYENKWVSARLSYNYRSSFVVSYDQVVDPALGAGVLSPVLPTNERGRGTLDFAGTVSPIDNISLTFQATNLLGAAARNFRTFNAQGQEYPWQTRFLESVYRVGIRFRF